jgi:hypothetical protein
MYRRVPRSTFRKELLEMGLAALSKTPLWLTWIHLFVLCGFTSQIVFLLHKKRVGASAMRPTRCDDRRFILSYVS